MKKSFAEVDKFFLGIVIILVAIGVLFFTSASFGILAKNSSKFYNVLINQFALGLLGGFVLLYLFQKIPYIYWRKYAFYIFIGAILLTAAVFIPGLGFSHGGAMRWISIGPISFQPAEVLKIAFVMYFAGWLSWMKSKAQDMRFSIIPLIIMLGIIAAVLFHQPDTKSFILMAVAALAMLIVYGISWKQLLMFALIICIGLGGLLMAKPYLRDRLMTFIDPSRDNLGSSYQLQQSLIAIGSGGVVGRGVGQSVQKFSYLPEPQGDSIFAVIGEEVGFVGTSVIIILYVLFALRGLRIGHNAPDDFARLLVVGLIVLFTAQSFLNIASITGLFPLTGVPLVFISHGGTSLAITLSAIGIILNVSKYRVSPKMAKAKTVRV
jgi:cell division protein FtsW